jgi:L-methionine (R)-S-oxide reductase
MGDKSAPVGVLDLDSTVLATFDGDDKEGLEGIVDILSKACDWE